MIGRGAQERQAERHVHGVIEVEQLHRDEALVVIERDHRVVLALAGVAEDDVGDRGPAEDGAIAGERACACDRGLDQARFFVAEMSAFAGVRVEPGDGDARTRDAEAAHERVRGLHDRAHDAVAAVARKELWNARERDVRGHERHAQARAGEHHRHRQWRRAVGREPRREQLGVAGEREARRLARGLVNRRRAQRR